MDPNRFLLPFGAGNPGFARMALPMQVPTANPLFHHQTQIPMQIPQMAPLPARSTAASPFAQLGGLPVTTCTTPITVMIQHQQTPPAPSAQPITQHRPMLIAPSISTAIQAGDENEAKSAAAQANKRLLSQSPWKEYKTDQGRVYYHNPQTKETTWTLPEEFTSIRKQLDEKPAVEKEEEKKEETTVQAEPTTVIAPVTTAVSGESELERAMQATLDYENKKAAAENAADDANSAVKSTAADLSDTEYQRELRRRQCDVFRDLLRDKYNDGRITSTSSWEHSVKYLQQDSRFRVLNKVSEKKQIFNAWKTQRQKEERDEKRLAIKKAKEELEKWLQANPKMTPRVRYSKAHEWFAADPEWKSVGDDDRREIFRDVQNFLDRQEREAEKVTRRKNIKALADILDGMEQVTYRTTWAQAQRLLVENSSFMTDKNLQNMDKEDALIVFEEHIRALEKEEGKEKELEKKRLMRQRRKNREAFQQFLQEMHKRNQLTSISLWCELYPMISADQRFHNMLGQPGSTPLDLFKFYVEDLKAQYGQDRRIIKTILKEKNLAVETSTKFEDFQKWILEDDRAKSVDSGNMKLCYNSFVDKAETREKERLKEEQRKKRRLESAFRSVLKQMAPPIDPETKWEDVRPKMADETAFLAIEEETERHTIFTDYVRNLAEACGHHHSVSKKKKEKKKRRRPVDLSSNESEPEAGEVRSERRQKKKKRKDKDSESANVEKEGRKDKKKKKKRKASVSDENNESSKKNTGKTTRSKRSGSKDSGELNSEGELSEGELERKRKELLKQLNDS